MVAARQRRQPGSSCRLNGIRGFVDSFDTEEFDRLRDLFDFAGAEAGAAELASQEAVRGIAAHDLAGRRGLFESEGDGSRLPGKRDSILGRLHNRGPSVQAEPRIHLQMMFAPQLFVQGLQRVHEAERAPGSAACRILERHRIAEARQQPMLVTLHQGAVELAHRRCANLLEVVNQLGLILRIEFQVRLRLERFAATNQNRDLPALSLATAARRQVARGAKPDRSRRAWRNHGRNRHTARTRHHELQVSHHLASRLIPFRRGLGHCTRDDCGTCFGKCGVHRARIGDGSVAV
jgi:hypothetical protein